MVQRCCNSSIDKFLQNKRFLVYTFIREIAIPIFLMPRIAIGTKIVYTLDLFTYKAYREMSILVAQSLPDLLK